jgi:hypothetical protein
MQLPVSTCNPDKLVVQAAKPFLPTLYCVKRIFVHATVIDAFGMGDLISYLDGLLKRIPPFITK